MTSLQILILFYFIFCFSCYMSASLSLKPMRLTRKNLNAKSRKEIDCIIEDTNLYKKYSLLWPYVLYLVLKSNNE